MCDIGSVIEGTAIWSAGLVKRERINSFVGVGERGSFVVCFPSSLCLQAEAIVKFHCVKVFTVIKGVLVQTKNKPI